MRILTLAAAALLLVGCSQKSLTFSFHTGEVVATVKTTSAQDISTVVTETKEAMEKACAANGMKLGTPGESFIEWGMIVEILKQLAKWLPSHTITLQGQCVWSS